MINEQLVRRKHAWVSGARKPDIGMMGNELQAGLEAIAVHSCNGAWRLLSVGLFGDGFANESGLQGCGIFFGDPGQLVAQLIHLVACFVYVFGISWIFFALYKRFYGLRVSAETELRGFDIPEMGSLGYNPDAEFSEPPVAVAASASGGGGRYTEDYCKLLYCTFWSGS